MWYEDGRIVHQVVVLVLGGISAGLIATLWLIAWQYYIKLRHEYIYTIIYRCALAAINHFGTGATDAIRADWVVYEVAKILPRQDSQLVLMYAKASLATMTPTSGDDDTELEELLQ